MTHVSYEEDDNCDNQSNYSLPSKIHEGRYK
jgi:hypothetical protein